MFGVIFDTNIYGRIFEDKESGTELIERIKTNPKFMIHNFKLIRNELRGAPKILPLYDGLVSRRVIEESGEIRGLAMNYFERYKLFGGNKGKTKMMNDLKIIACATLLNCDLVFSDDVKSMLSLVAVKAYRDVNLLIGMRTPTFYTYKDLKRRFSAGLQ